MPAPFARPIDATTRLCGVVGHPVRHSASPAMQNAGLAALDLNWSYVALDVEPERLADAIRGAQAMHFIGLNLTVPHKLLAMELVDVLDDSAKMWGAVNTIRFEGRDTAGAWRPLRDFAEALPSNLRSHGFNTDASAIDRSLREDLQFNPAGASVLLLGAGGAGRVAALKLASEAIGELYLVNRTRAHTETVAAEMRKRFPAVKVFLGYPKGPVDLLLNATSLGLNANDPLPFDESEFALNRARAVYDMIYRPAVTPLLKAAESAGCKVANGLGMLLYQGAEALELWSGRKAPMDVMRDALRRNVYG